MDEISPQWYKIVGIAFFYVAILLVGIYATKQGQKKRRASMDLAEDSIVAGRNIGTFQFCFRSLLPIIKSRQHCPCFVSLCPDSPEVLSGIGQH